MSDLQEPWGTFGLVLAAISQRLDRLEALAGITEPVPADVELDALLESDA